MTFRSLLLGLVPVVAAFAAQPAPPFAYQPMGVPDGCFVESVAFYDAVRERYGKDTWCRLLQWGAKEEEEVVAGHAVGVFELQGRLWGWDVNFGFAPLAIAAAQKEQVDLIAAPLTARYPDINPRFPIYRNDFEQSPDVAPTVGMEGGPDPVGIHHALKVATRLAKHRPVNVVMYTHRAGGRPGLGVACVFIFHGRLCVYVPGYGTVPFRARALSVENLRQLQQALHTIHPGAGNLRAM